MKSTHVFLFLLFILVPQVQSKKSRSPTSSSKTNLRINDFHHRSHSAYHSKPQNADALRYSNNKIDPFQSVKKEQEDEARATELQLNGKNGDRSKLLQEIFKQATTEAQFRDAETLQQEQEKDDADKTRHLPDMMPPMDPLQNIRQRKMKTGSAYAKKLNGKRNQQLQK
jgi:hypothetical protein